MKDFLQQPYQDLFSESGYNEGYVAYNDFYNAAQQTDFIPYLAKDVGKSTDVEKSKQTVTRLLQRSVSGAREYGAPVTRTIQSKYILVMVCIYTSLYSLYN